MNDNDTTLYLNAEEQAALERVLRQASNKVADLPEYWAIGVREDIRLLQDRLDAAITDTLVKEGGL